MHILLVDCKLVQLLWKRQEFYHEVKHTPTIQPRNPNAVYLPRKMKIYVHIRTCRQMFIAALSVSQKLKMTTLSVKWINTFRPCI